MSADGGESGASKPSPTKQAWADSSKPLPLESTALDSLREMSKKEPVSGRDQLKRGLARLSRSHPSAIDFLKGMGPDDFSEFMTEFTEYLGSDAAKKDYNYDWESMGMVSDVRMLSEERRKEMEAIEELVKTLEVGMRVQRRYKGREWGEGYVTSLDPLRVTLSSTDASGEGYKWAEVRHVPADRLAELKAEDDAKAAEAEAFKRLLTKLKVGMLVERADDSGRWTEGYVASLEPLKITNSSADPQGWAMEWPKVRMLPPERQAELDALEAEKQRLLSQLEIGMRVERRYDNSEWGEGFVTSLDPLEVTVSSVDPKSEGYRWAEVRVLPPDKMAQFEAHKQLLKKLTIGMRVERRYEASDWGEGFVTNLDPLEVTLSDKNPKSECYKWSEVRLLSEERLAELAAYDALLKQLTIGMRVERRYKGGEWGEGFVTQIEPNVKVTMSCNDKATGGIVIGNNEGYEWHEIRLITPERAKELEAMKEAVPPIRPEDRPMSSAVSAAADADASS